jgi:5-bromo-4-chloroindolyl phosphate hydrolysis protein
MLEGDLQERQVRAARNQSMFRAINEQMTKLNEAFHAATATYVIACECADTSCIRTLDIATEEYEAIRKEPNRFAVLAGHVYPEVETVTEETERYVVVEKFATAALVAQALDPRGE